MKPFHMARKILLPAVLLALADRFGMETNGIGRITAR